MSSLNSQGSYHIKIIFLIRFSYKILFQFRLEYVQTGYVRFTKFIKFRSGVFDVYFLLPGSLRSQDPD